MSYQPVLNDILEFQTVTQFGNQISENRNRWKVTSVVGGPVSQLLIAQAYNAIVAPLYKSILLTAATYRGVSVQKIWPLPKPVPEATVALAGPGTEVGFGFLPSQTSGIITTSTGLAGRSQRGRQYIGFPANQDNDVDGTPIAGYVAILNSLGAVMQSTLTVTFGLFVVTLDPVIYHPLSHVGDRVTSAFGRKKWATQRRRGVYGRPNVLPF